MSVYLAGPAVCVRPTRRVAHRRASTTGAEHRLIVADEFSSVRLFGDRAVRGDRARFARTRGGCGRRRGQGRLGQNGHSRETGAYHELFPELKPRQAARNDPSRKLGPVIAEVLKVCDRARGPLWAAAAGFDGSWDASAWQAARGRGRGRTVPHGPGRGPIRSQPARVKDRAVPGPQGDPVARAVQPRHHPEFVGSHALTIRLSCGARTVPTAGFSTLLNILEAASLAMQQRRDRPEKEPTPARSVGDRPPLGLRARHGPRRRRDDAAAKGPGLPGAVPGLDGAAQAWLAGAGHADAFPAGQGLGPSLPSRLN